MAGKKEVYLDLYSIADMVHKVKSADQLSGFGVILDASWPYKSEHADDYFVRMKLIDSKLNPVDAEEKRYIIIYVFSKDKDQLPILAKLGAIVKFKRIKVNL